MKKFLLIGLGYVSKKHVEAIAECGHELTAVCDVHNTAGWIDKYFPKARFLYPADLKDEYDFVSVCTPNYTHIHYINEFPNAQVICEKPLVLPNEADAFIRQDVNVILQLRYHQIASQLNTMGDLNIDYFTYRGDWYDRSWKGKQSLSGGIICNIGIHIIDLIIHSLGRPKGLLTQAENRTASIEMIYPGKRVKINIDLNREFKRTINGVPLNGFDDLHNKCYEEILNGKGFKTQDALQSLKLLNHVYEKMV